MRRGSSFGLDVIEGFWRDGDARNYLPATRMPYLKLTDRLYRLLVAIGVRDANPASKLVLGQCSGRDRVSPATGTDGIGLEKSFNVGSDGRTPLSYRDSTTRTFPLKPVQARSASSELGGMILRRPAS